LQFDLRRRESAEILVKKTLERFGRIDALLNIAGAVPQIDLFEMTDEQWRDGMDGVSGVPGGEVVDRHLRPHRRRRNQRYLRIALTFWRSSSQVLPSFTMLSVGHSAQKPKYYQKR